MNPCFICAAPGLCAHREDELIGDYLRMGCELTSAPETPKRIPPERERWAEWRESIQRARRAHGKA